MRGCAASSPPANRRAKSQPCTNEPKEASTAASSTSASSTRARSKCERADELARQVMNPAAMSLLRPPTRSDGWPADEPQCDEAALKRRGIRSRPVREVRMEDDRVPRIERDQRSTALVEDARIGIGSVVIEVHRAARVRAGDDAEAAVHLIRAIEGDDQI